MVWWDLKIKIAERLRPYSHVPGTRCILPGSEIELEIFPALIRAYQNQQLLSETRVDVQGPLDNFTVQLDLEKGGVRVFARGALDYFIRAAEGVPFVIEKKGSSLWQKKSTLSLGCHKAQDFALIKRRCDLTEVLPHWHRLGINLHPQGKRPVGGAATFLEQLRTCDKMEVVPLLKNLFRAGFSGILSPRLNDEEHQGFQLPPGVGSPLFLLSEGARFIEELFIKVEGAKVSLLPRLPPDFHAGRFIDLDVGFGTINFEWSKKLLEKVIFTANSEQNIEFYFQKALKSCRLRKNLKERGEKIACNFFISTKPGTTYYLDQFEK